MTYSKDKKIGCCFIVSAPSGTGKTTVVDELVKKNPNKIVRVITCTTRAPRGSEVNGIDYRFMSVDEFQNKVNTGSFLESQEIYDNRYGTLKSDVDEQINQGKHAFLVIDVQGAASLMGVVKATTIFLMPPSFEELEKRIRTRKQDDEKAINIRLSKAKNEMQQVKKYEYVVENDKVDKAVAMITKIVEEVEKKQFTGEN